MKRLFAISLTILMMLACLTSCGNLPSVTADQFESEMKAIGASISDMPPSGFNNTSVSKNDVETINAYVTGSTLTFTTCKTAEQAEEVFAAYIAECEKHYKASSNYSSKKSEGSSPDGKTCKITISRLGGSDSKIYSYASQIDNCVITVTTDGKSYTGKLKEALDSFGIKL